jgi:hypothetical protein
MNELPASFVGGQDILKAENEREALLLVANEIRHLRGECQTHFAAIDEKLTKQNGTVRANDNRITKLETVNKVVGGLFLAVAATVGAIITKLVQGGA